MMKFPMALFLSADLRRWPHVPDDCRLRRRRWREHYELSLQSEADRNSSSFLQLYWRCQKGWVSIALMRSEGWPKESHESFSNNGIVRCRVTRITFLILFRFRFWKTIHFWIVQKFRGLLCGLEVIPLYNPHQFCYSSEFLFHFLNIFQLDNTGSAINLCECLKIIKKIYKTLEK